MGDKVQQLHLRVTKEHKKWIKERAAKTGQTITDFIIAGLQGAPTKDYNLEKEFFLQLNVLTKELGHIGNNINQVTIAIHQINKSQKMEQGEFAEFNKLMQQYPTKFKSIEFGLIDDMPPLLQL
jgi:hypothetical protein